MNTESPSLLQLVQRLLLVFMPAKYQPDYDYLRHVPIRRVHLFTAIQIICLIVLWVVKSVKSISIGFPVMVSTFELYDTAKLVSEYDQEISLSQTADNPMAPQGRATQP